MCPRRAGTQMFFTCLFNFHKCLQTLKHGIKVFNELLVDVREDSSECEKVCVSLGNYVQRVDKWGTYIGQLENKNRFYQTLHKH